MNIALIDNYDSFTYNLVQYIEENSGVSLEVIRNDDFILSDLSTFDKIVISPGPGLPKENGIIIEVIKRFSGEKPILGVCLGLQAIYEAFGGQLINLKEVHHGVSSSVFILDGQDLILTGINSPFLAGRYHSWVCDRNIVPSELLVTAIDEHKQIMACRHHHHQTYGVQFHPESILTPEGKKMVRNFIEM
ncbi:MAG: aminodeoxychorismate/anthranilate synthase component II [Saprospiraceae bacterium]|uniref:Aminodeoxychorismate/anthranilate synthase component II n=1 Tax=Candidatus Opimibacter skivensis TaxID=2982028 RepID=A0A9D7SV42_9BACT|nr:aminodeoxychorismate/anthranilate synthase component II [Candidatus Opimibacter skivensis]